MKENQILDSDLIKTKEKPVPSAVLAILLVGMGVFIGATTNLVNGNVSELYFQRIMGWEFDGIWKAVVWQGVFEGLIYGVIFSIVFTIGFAVITEGKADWNFVKKQLKKVVLVIYGCWVIGGIVAMILAFAYPEEYSRFIHGVPNEAIPRVRYAWVGGSIWGGMIGGIVSMFYGLIATYRAWKQDATIFIRPNKA